VETGPATDCFPASASSGFGGRGLEPPPPAKQGGRRARLSLYLAPGPSDVRPPLPRRQVCGPDPGRPRVPLPGVGRAAPPDPRPRGRPPGARPRTGRVRPRGRGVWSGPRHSLRAVTGKQWLEVDRCCPGMSPSRSDPPLLTAKEHEPRPPVPRGRGLRNGGGGGGGQRGRRRGGPPRRCGASVAPDPRVLPHRHPFLSFPPAAAPATPPQPPPPRGSCRWDPACRPQGPPSWTAWAPPSS